MNTVIHCYIMLKNYENHIFLVDVKLFCSWLFYLIFGFDFPYAIDMKSFKFLVLFIFRKFIPVFPAFPVPISFLAVYFYLSLSTLLFVSFSKIEESPISFDKKYVSLFDELFEPLLYLSSYLLKLFFLDLLRDFYSFALFFLLFFSAFFF
jgi:hypothetical protein